METVKNIASILGCLISIFTLTAIFTDKGRKLLSVLVHKNTIELQQQNEQQNQDITYIKQKMDLMLDRFDAIEEVSKQQCRNTIKNIYYKYQQDKKIPLYERKCVDNTYRIYHDELHGNSYVELLYREICKWEINTIHSYEELEREDN